MYVNVKYLAYIIQFGCFYGIIMGLLFIISLIKKSYCACYDGTDIVSSYFKNMLFAKNIQLLTNTASIYGMYIVVMQFTYMQTIMLLLFVGACNIFVEVILCNLFSLKCTLGLSGYVFATYLLDYLIHFKINKLLVLCMILHVGNLFLIPDISISSHFTGKFSGIFAGIFAGIFSGILSSILLGSVVNII